MLTSSLRHRLNGARTVATNHLYTITAILKSKNTKYYCKQSKKTGAVAQLMEFIDRSGSSFALI